MAHQLMSPSEVKKEPVEKKGDNAGNGENKDLFDSDVFAKEQSYQQQKQKNLANLVKKSQKTVKGRGGKNMLNEYLENADVMVCRINKFQTMYPNTPVYPNPLLHDGDVPESLKSKIQKFVNEDGTDGTGNVGYQHKIPAKCFLDERSFIVQEKYYKDIIELQSCFKFMRAGPRREVIYKREETKAAIVTCGGLCPGLNVVIKSIVDCLSYEYGVTELWGIRWGYRGFYESDDYWKKLTPDNVQGIQNIGGTILGSSRGGFDGPKMIAALKQRGINQLYVVGGDGTHRGINNLIQ